MNILLSPDVPVASLNVATGATDAHFDLSNLKITSMDISVGAASAHDPTARREPRGNTGTLGD